MKNCFSYCAALLVAVFALAAVAMADGYLRASAAIPGAASGTNAVVAVHFPKDKVVEVAAFDVLGTAGGTVEAYVIRRDGGFVTTNIIAATAAVAPTNAVPAVDRRAYLYNGENALFKFSEGNGGAVVVYGNAK